MELHVVAEVSFIKIHFKTVKKGIQNEFASVQDKDSIARV